MKRTPADIAFSKLVRMRTNFSCERCGAVHLESSKGLHCSHFHGRGKWGTRFDPRNAFAHCYGCHQYLGSHPTEFEKWAMDRLGEAAFNDLLKASQDISLGKLFSKTKGKGDIAAHFRSELEKMRHQRLTDSTRIEFLPYPIA